ncbi:MAG: site-specific DNA-methyltransferase [Kineosporiaceae bacterium]|nr:site-specific DNA-methyltransferase [Kineosporiaceae bacterium]
MEELVRNRILTGDALTRLGGLPEASVDCVVTSPPYFALRDYGTSGQLGLEGSVGEWVIGLRAVARGMARVLKPTGAFWLNLGDSFSTHQRYGAAPKSLLLAPERLVLALAEDGWVVRNKVIWAKTNAMPTSVRDRLALNWEVLFLLVRSPAYYFDLDAIREPHRSVSRTRTSPPSPTARQVAEGWTGPLAASRSGLALLKAEGRAGHPLGKNPGDVWRTATSSFPGAHFATFPPVLVRRPILATCPRWVCSHCGLPCAPDQATQLTTAGPSCGLAVDPRPGVVLDPFFGSGTVGLVAQELGRDWLGIELNPDYVRLAQQRLGLADGPPMAAAA